MSFMLVMCVPVKIENEINLQNTEDQPRDYLKSAVVKTWTRVCRIRLKFPPLLFILYFSQCSSIRRLKSSNSKLSINLILTA